MKPPTLGETMKLFALAVKGVFLFFAFIILMILFMIAFFNGLLILL